MNNDRRRQQMESGVEPKRGKVHQTGRRQGPKVVEALPAAEKRVASSKME